MAQVIPISNTGESAKVRSPVGVVVLSFVTCGIYALVWYYKINKELAALGRSRGTTELGDSPGKSLLAITLGAIVVVPALISLVHTFKRIQTAQRLNGAAPLNGWLALLLAAVLGAVFYGYMQSGMNAALAGETGSVGVRVPAAA
jgi:hypothetical protein